MIGTTLHGSGIESVWEVPRGIAVERELSGSGAKEVAVVFFHAPERWMEVGRHFLCIQSGYCRGEYGIKAVEELRGGDFLLEVEIDRLALGMDSCVGAASCLQCDFVL